MRACILDVHREGPLYRRTVAELEREEREQPAEYVEKCRRMNDIFHQMEAEFGISIPAIKTKA